MFHIKPDKRSQSSAALITKGLFTCMQQKPFSAITITDVQKASTVGRATFYRLFDSLPDVLAYECDKVFAQIVARQKQVPDLTDIEAQRLFFATWQEHSFLLRAIMDSNHLELLYGTYRKYIPVLKEILSPNISLSEEETDYAAGFVIAGVVSILTTWVRRGEPKAPEDLAGFFRRAIEIINPT
ncbi:MAG: TetR/AcrR family transcriptional regulator [Selenomonas sp.]|nr:TetR/AcrR family transcriptional regulator [Selenomonas sp.]